MHYYKLVLKKYIQFTGRATRSEYWYFALFNTLISMALAIIASGSHSDSIRNTFVNLYALAVFLPSLGVTFRRLHDTDRSAWWLLLSFVPIVGWIILIVFLATDSTPGDNKYGPNPKVHVQA